MTKIQVKRGTRANLPDLAAGEYGFTTDTGELFIGAAEGNRQIPLLASNGKLPANILPDPEFGDLLGTYGYSWTLDENTETKETTIVVTVGSSCPFDASMTAVIQELDDGSTTINITTTVDGSTSKSTHTLNAHGGQGGLTNE